MSVKSNPGRNGQQSPQEWGIQILLALYKERPTGNNKTEAYTMWEVWNEAARKGSWTKDTPESCWGRTVLSEGSKKNAHVVALTSSDMYQEWRKEGIYSTTEQWIRARDRERWVQICSIICASLTWGQGGIPALGDMGVITPRNPNSAILMLGDNQFTLLFTISSFLSWRQSPRHKHTDFTDSLNRQAIWLKDPVTAHSE